MKALAARTVWVLLLLIWSSRAMGQQEVVQGPLGLLPRIDKHSIGTATILGVRLQVVF